jgi:hypothetical protein
VADASVVAVVANRTLEVVPIGPGALPQPRRGNLTEVAFEAGAELVLEPAEFRDLVAGALDPAAVRLVAGESEAVVRVTRTFRIEPVGPRPGASSEAGEGGDAGASGAPAASVA